MVRNPEPRMEWIVSSRIVYDGSEVYIETTITADVELDAQTVTISVDDGTTWLTAAWQGDAGTTRTARTSSVVDIDTALPVKGIYAVKAKVDDGTETEVIRCGGLTYR